MLLPPESYPGILDYISPTCTIRILHIFLPKLLYSSLGAESVLIVSLYSQHPENWYIVSVMCASVITNVVYTPWGSIWGRAFEKIKPSTTIFKTNNRAKGWQSRTARQKPPPSYTLRSNYSTCSQPWKWPEDCAVGHLSLVEQRRPHWEEHRAELWQLRTQALLPSLCTRTEWEGD